ncbi:riboflavin synthase [bacterium]|nr:riboflavin synthase [bacterium]
MFTGIVEDLGVIQSIELKQVTLETKLKGWKIGDSVSVNGICLTVVKISPVTEVFCLLVLEVMPETIEKTNLGQWKTGTRVNLERAVCLGERLNGHIVTGHIDGIGIIRKIKTQENAKIIEISVSAGIIKHIAPKGSISVDGISLTVVDNGIDYFSVSLIPYTINHTTLNFKVEEDKVNIETDILAKYIEQIKKSENTRLIKNEINQDYLEKYGFV